MDVWALSLMLSGMVQEARGFRAGKMFAGPFLSAWVPEGLVPGDREDMHGGGKSVVTGTIAWSWLWRRWLFPCVAAYPLWRS